MVRHLHMWKGHWLMAVDLILGNVLEPQQATLNIPGEAMK